MRGYRSLNEAAACVCASHYGSYMKQSLLCFSFDADEQEYKTSVTAKAWAGFSMFNALYIRPPLPTISVSGYMSDACGG